MFGPLIAVNSNLYLKIYPNIYSKNEKNILTKNINRNLSMLIISNYLNNEMI
jgi:hypothetical protein